MGMQISGRGPQASPAEGQDLNRLNPVQFAKYAKATKMGMASPQESMTRAGAAGLNPVRAAYGKGAANVNAWKKGIQ